MLAKPYRIQISLSKDSLWNFLNFHSMGWENPVCSQMPQWVQRAMGYLRALLGGWQWFCTVHHTQSQCSHTWLAHQITEDCLLSRTCQVSQTADFKGKYLPFCSTSQSGFPSQNLIRFVSGLLPGPNQFMRQIPA